MLQVTPDVKALRQWVIVCLLSFFLGMASVLVLVGWLMWRFVEPDTRWFDLLHIAVNALIWSVIGGLAFAAGASWLIIKWQYGRGMYRCANCGRPLKSFDASCDCSPYGDNRNFKPSRAEESSPDFICVHRSSSVVNSTTCSMTFQKR